MSPLGSKAHIEASPPDARFIPESGHSLRQSECPLCARSGHSASMIFVPSGKTWVLAWQDDHDPPRDWAVNRHAGSRLGVALLGMALVKRH
jgi:hypothetical protein